MLKIFHTILTQLQISAGQQNKLCFSFVSKVFENLFFLLLKCFILVVFGFNFVFLLELVKNLLLKLILKALLLNRIIPGSYVFCVCFFFKFK